MGDLTALIKLVMLIEQIPSIDGCVDTGAKILAEASIFHHVGTNLLPRPALNLLGHHEELVEGGDFPLTLGRWLLGHHGRRLWLVSTAGKDGCLRSVDGKCGANHLLHAKACSKHKCKKIKRAGGTLPYHRQGKSMHCRCMTWYPLVP